MQTNKLTLTICSVSSCPLLDINTSNNTNQTNIASENTNQNVILLLLLKK